MKEREKIVITGLLFLLLLLWLGFMFHANPTFAGSLPGLILGVAGSILMLIPSLYLFVKRIKPLKEWATRYVSMRTMLAWHVYTGILGPILIVFHTGHKFESPLGISLMALTLSVVISGFVARYLMSMTSKEIKEKKSMLIDLRADYKTLMSRLHDQGEVQQLARYGFFKSLALRWSAPILTDGRQSTKLEALRLVESIADVEYALRTHETFKSAFSKCLKIHIALSVVLYLLITLHIYSEFYYGLRWLN